MNRYVIIATGQSLTADDVDYCRGKANVIVVSDAYKMAPWADILVSRDRAWWDNNPEARHFEGDKYSYYDSTSVSEKRPIGMPVGCNSGLYAMLIARDLGADEVILLGFDMHGTHFFGKHPEPLKNTTGRRFLEHIAQFRSWGKLPVVNCTPGSALTQFPMKNIKDVL